MKTTTKISTALFGIGAAALAVLIAISEFSIQVQGIQVKWILFGLLLLGCADSFRRILIAPKKSSQAEAGEP